MPQDVFSANLVVEQVEAVGRLRLRLTIQLPLKDPDLFGVARLIANHLHLSIFESHQKSGSFPPPELPGFNGTTTLSDSRRSRRPDGDVEAATLARDGSPPITRITLPTCRAHYPGGSNGCTSRLLPRPRGLPRYAGGSASATSLSRPAQASLTLRPTGLLNRPRRPLSRGFDPASYPTEPLVSYQTNRQLSGWILPPLVIRAFGAHCMIQVRARARQGSLKLERVILSGDSRRSKRSRGMHENRRSISATKLVVITDGLSGSRLPIHIDGVAVKSIYWNDIRRIKGIGDGALLIDIDLRDISKVKTVKDNLPNRRRNQCTVVAIDRKSHFSEVQAHGLGATDLLKRPSDAQELTQILHRHFGHATARERSGPGVASIASATAVLEGLFTTLICDGTLQIKEISRAGDQVIDAIAEIGSGQWLNSVRNYHEGTFQHCLLVTGVATAFGLKLGMRRSDISKLTIAGLFHDIGKAQIPLEVLDKSGRLSDEEFSIIKSHPVVGHKYLSTQGEVAEDICDAVLHHHEYLDGSGYPDGLAGNQINDLTRILTICDVYGALIERRAYKAPQSLKLALEILTNMASEGKVEQNLVRALGYVMSPQT